MKLRIVSGSLKGRFLTLPDRRAKFRPTQERVRQSIAEKIKEFVPGAKAADLCAGSGALGFELISRGAASVHFVESDKLYGPTIADHAKTLGVQGQCTVQVCDVERFINRCDQAFDIVFYDPPYEDRLLASLAPKLLAICAAGGVVVYEYASGAAASSVVWPEPSDEFTRETRRYGETSVDFFFRR